MASLAVNDKAQMWKDAKASLKNSADKIIKCRRYKM